MTSYGLTDANNASFTYSSIYDEFDTSIPASWLADVINLAEPNIELVKTLVNERRQWEKYVFFMRGDVSSEFPRLMSWNDIPLYQRYILAHMPLVAGGYWSGGPNNARLHRFKDVYVQYEENARPFRVVRFGYVKDVFYQLHTDEDRLSEKTAVFGMAVLNEDLVYGSVGMGIMSKPDPIPKPKDNPNPIPKGKPDPTLSEKIEDGSVTSQDLDHLQLNNNNDDQETRYINIRNSIRNLTKGLNEGESDTVELLYAEYRKLDKLFQESEFGSWAADYLGGDAFPLFLAWQDWKSDTEYLKKMAGENFGEVINDVNLINSWMMRVLGHSSSEFPPVPVSQEIQNTSTIHVRTGQIYEKDSEGFRNYGLLAEAFSRKPLLFYLPFRIKNTSSMILPLIGPYGPSERIRDGYCVVIWDHGNPAFTTIHICSKPSEAVLDPKLLDTTYYRFLIGQLGNFFDRSKPTPQSRNYLKTISDYASTTEKRNYEPFDGHLQTFTEPILTPGNYNGNIFPSLEAMDKEFYLDHIKTDPSGLSDEEKADRLAYIEAYEKDHPRMRPRNAK
jgi:hypothetical protein